MATERQQNRGFTTAARWLESVRAQRFMDAGIALCLLAMAWVLSDRSIQIGPLSLSTLGNPFRILLVLVALRSGVHGWPRLRSKGARRAMVLLLLLMAIPFLQPHADSDGDFYYAYLRSIVVDGDFSLINESAWNATGWMADHVTTVNNATGYGYSGATIGLAIFSAPFYIPTHIVMRILTACKLVPLADGYTMPEKMAVALTTLLGMILGAVFVYRIVRRWTDSFPAALSTAVVVLSSPILCYGYHEGSFAHGLALGLIAWWMWLWLTWRDSPSVNRYSRLGFVLGLTCLVRPQLVLFLILPWVDWLYFRNESPSFEKAYIKRAFFMGLALLAAWVVAFAPQMLIWQFERGSIFSAPQGQDYLELSRVNHLKVLFHWRHGLFTWHPVHLVGLLALPLIWKRSRGFSMLLFAGFLLQLTVNAAARDWDAGGAFGQRRMESVIPLVAMGLGALLQWGSKRGLARAALSVLCLLLVVWNILLLGQVSEGPIYYDNAMNPATIWTSQWVEGPTSLGRLLPQSPAWRALRIAWDGGLLRFAATAVVVTALAAALYGCVRCLAGMMGTRLLRRSRGVPWKWAVGPVLLASLFVVLHARTERVMTPVERDGELLWQNVRASSYAAFQGGGFLRTIPPGDSLKVQLPSPMKVWGLTLIGWLEDTHWWIDGRELGALKLTLASGETLTEPLISGEHLFPRNHAYLMHAFRPNTKDSIRHWVEPTSVSQRRPYISAAVGIRVRAESPVTALELVNDAEQSFHLEGLAFSDGPAVLPRHRTGGENPPSKAPRAKGRGEAGRALDLSSVTNTDYRHHVFKNWDLGPWSFYAHLQPGWWRSGYRKFWIRPPHAESGSWSVLSTAYRNGESWTIPLEGETGSIAFLWSTFETYDQKRDIRMQEPLATVEFHFPGNRIERTPIVAHRDVWDYRDRYAPERRCVTTDGFHWGKLHWSEIRVRGPSLPERLVIRDANGPSESGIALFAATVYPRKFLVIP